jgi:uncharacterized protein YndB with AHSA1/START domain
VSEQGNWSPTKSTDVEVRFEPSGSGTLVTVEHGGWDRVASAGRDQVDGYGEGWAELLGSYAKAMGEG